MKNDIVQDILEKIAGWESITNIKSSHIYLGQREISLLRKWTYENLIFQGHIKTYSDIFGGRKLHEVNDDGHLGIS